MNRIILAGIIIVLVIVAGIAGVMFFNSTDSNTSEVNNSTVSTNNQTVENNTTSTNNNSFPLSNSVLTLIPSNSVLTLIPSSNGHNYQSTPTPSPSPTPEPSPTQDSMDNIISLFNAYILSTYNQSLVPSLAVVIVQDDKIIYMNTLGVKDLDSGEPVDENTLFGIGSNTKAFSSTLIGELVSDGLMSWDDPLSDYFSVPDEFQLYSDNVTNEITVRDALLHRSGLPKLDGDLIWAGFNQPYMDIIYQLRYRENNTDFRSTWQYNNLIYTLPSFAAARVMNTTWYDLMKEDLLIPLGMNNSVTTYEDFLNSTDHATPYYLLKNGTMINFDINPDSVGPAGGIYSSINDMANWLKFQIEDTGYYNGVKILNKTELDETRTGQIQITNTTYYGFGWGVYDDYISHAGGLDAFKSQVTIYPSKGLGIVILANGGEYAGAYRTALDNLFRELLNGNDDYDPWPALKESIDESWQPETPTSPVVDPSLDLSGYVGVYTNTFYGDINITTDNGTLYCYYGLNSYAFELEHWNNNTFKDDIFDNYFDFSDIENGTSQKVVLRLSDSPENATFNRTNST